MRAQALLVLLFLCGAWCSPCRYQNGPYQLTYGIRNGVVHFRLVLSNIQPGSLVYTGVGFGDGMYAGLDAIIVRLMNGRVIVTDEYVRGYNAPFPDRINNVNVHNTRFVNGNIVAAFSRAIRSTESPYDANLNGCTTWQYLAAPSRMSPQGQLFHHVRTPVRQVVCLDRCLV